MSNLINTFKNTQNPEKQGQAFGSGIYVKEDDQDWGSSGMNDIKDPE